MLFIFCHGWFSPQYAALAEYLALLSHGPISVFIYLPVSFAVAFVAGIIL